MTAEDLQEGMLKTALATDAIAVASVMPSFANRSEPIDPVQLYQQIGNHEGIKDTVYLDTKGHPTVGIGFNLDSSVNKEFLNRNPDIKQKIFNKTPLTKRDIQILYNFSLRIAYADAIDIFPNFQKLPKTAKKVILDMSFNLGKPRLSKFTKMRAAILKYDFDTAADEMVDSKWYRQVKTRGKNLELMMRSINK